MKKYKEGEMKMERTADKVEHGREWTAGELDRVASELEGSHPVDVLRWVDDNFSTDEYALACSFGEPILIDMILKVNPRARVFSIDTGLHFPETMALKEKIESKYDIEIECIKPEMSLEEMEEKYGPELWKRDPDKCCKIRKVEPLTRFLKTLRCWITGIRRDQSPTRACAPVVGVDRRYGLVKVNPLVTWTARDVWKYMKENDVPYNELLDKAYPSIGCEPCTEPVRPGEDPRSGRWSGSSKTECGLHK